MIDSAVLFANNASSRLYQDTASGSATIRVQDGHGDKFPQPVGDGSNWFIVTVEDRRTGQIEIMKCTARTGDILNVVRAQEATIAQDFIAGANVSNRLTAGTMETFFQFNGYSMTDADARFVNVTGDTMTGPLTLPGDPTNDLHAATKKYVDDVSIDEAPGDGRAYARVGSSHDWLVIGTGIPEAPTDGKLYGRRSLTWHEAPTIEVFNTEITNRTNADTALSTRINNADAVNATQNTRLDAIENTDAVQNAHLTSIDTINNTQNSRLDTIEDLDLLQNGRLSSVETKNTEQDGRLTAIETKNATQDSRLDGIDTLNNTQNSRLTAVEGVNTTQNTRLDAVEAKNTAQDGTLTSYGTRITNTENMNTTQNGRLDAIEVKNASQDTQINLRLTDAPSDGFVYGRKNGAWATVIGGATTDDNPPAGPLQDGQMWWKSSTGSLYIWYDDGNSQQWIQISGPTQVAPQSSPWETVEVRDVTVAATSQTFVNLGAYRDLRLRMALKNTAAAVYSAQVSEDNGATWIATNYATQSDYGSASTAGAVATSAQTAFPLSNSNPVLNSSAGTSGLNGSLDLFDFNKAVWTSFMVDCYYQVDPAGAHVVNKSGGVQPRLNADNGLKIQSTGAFTGRLVLQGIRG
jgi:hypothetical protein